MSQRFAHALLVFALAAPAAGEIYRWTDADGAVHYTQDLSQVPAAARAAAAARSAAAATSETGRLQRFESTPAARVPGARARGTHRIPFRRHGTLMIVDVRLNDRVQAPFLVDTGASGVAIPAQLARQLGIGIGPDTPRQLVQTANGVIAEPMVALDSVQVGAARVEGMQALVSSSMEIGLLGGAFFNNYVYRVDSAAGEITLEPNEAVRGGLSRDQWTERYREIRERLLRAERRLEEARGVRSRELRTRRDELAQALLTLDRAANRAEVPRAWRE